MKKDLSHQERLDALLEMQNLANAEAELSRARSVSVGTAFGGTTEILLRKQNGEVVWAIMQPVEVIELIHQLASNVGCHLNLQPRQDFSSWRNWKYTEEELLQYRGPQALPGQGHAPHVNDLAPHQDKGQVLPLPTEQPGLNINEMVKEKDVVAT